MKLKEFNLKSSTQLFDICQKVIQIKSQIESAAISTNATLDIMPDSVISTKDLYEITAGFSALFDKCLANDLVKSGSQLIYRNRIQ